MAKTFPAERIREVLSYDRHTNELRWKVSGHGKGWGKLVTNRNSLRIDGVDVPRHYVMTVFDEQQEPPDTEPEQYLNLPPLTREQIRAARLPKQSPLSLRAHGRRKPLPPKMPTGLTRKEREAAKRLRALKVPEQNIALHIEGLRSAPDAPTCPRIPSEGRIINHGYGRRPNKEHTDGL
jgi:hypothetical protein